MWLIWSIVLLTLLIPAFHHQTRRSLHKVQPSHAVEKNKSVAQTFAAGFSSPNAALYDPDQDVYFISNINGRPRDKDGNGYISRISASDRKIELKWIDGLRKGVVLNAPKGMAIRGDELWVSDIDSLSRFDRKTGRAMGQTSVPGSVFLNELTIGDDGSIYVSDSGMTQVIRTGRTGRSRKRIVEDTQAIYRIDEKNNVTRVFSGEKLHQPTGVAFAGGHLWIVTFGSNELIELTGGANRRNHELPSGTLDGIVALPDGRLLISSWEANGIFLGPPSGPFQQIVDRMNSPAGIAFDEKRNLLVIPNLLQDEVTLQPISVR